MVVHIFSDISYHPKLNIGVVAFRIIDDSDGKSVLTILHKDGMRNTQLEKESINIALETLDNIEEIDQIIIYTDCQDVISNKYADNISIVKIKAHKKKSECNNLELCLREVDIESRRELRKRVKHMNI